MQVVVGRDVGAVSAVWPKASVMGLKVAGLGKAVGRRDAALFVAVLSAVWAQVSRPVV